MEAAQQNKKPRLFIIDHWAMGTFWEEARQADDAKLLGVQHACRALFYLRKCVPWLRVVGWLLVLKASHR